MTTRDLAIAKLQQLSEPLLQVINDYIDSVLHQHPNAIADSQASQKLVTAWEKWFDEVEQLDIIITEPVSEYQSLLLNKYRQQGLTL